MPHSHLIPSIAKNVHELRIRSAEADWRIIYRPDPDAVVILEVFSKKSQKTPQGVIHLRSPPGGLRRYLLGANMKKSKIDRLRAAGWKVGTTQDFLGLTDEEIALIELKLGMGQSLRVERESQELTQSDLAKRIGSSQSRVAKMEAGTPEVSLDLMVEAAFSLGISQRDLGKRITAIRSRRSGKKAG